MCKIDRVAIHAMRRSGAMLYMAGGLALLLVACAGRNSGSEAPSAGRRSSLRFEISFPDSIQKEAADGRVFLMLSTSNVSEPRFQVAKWTGGQPFFGMDVDGLAPNTAAVIDDGVLGSPLKSISDIPAGEYYVQGMLNLYTTFKRADGHAIKAHMDQGEGQHWNVSPGNLFSTVDKVRIDPAKGGVVKISLAKRVPPFVLPQDTKYVKHIRLRSTLLSDFWGRDMYIGAVVLLPPGFDEHPKARYPVAYWQDHFHPTFFTPVGFREAAPNNGTADIFASYDTSYVSKYTKCVVNWICDEAYDSTYQVYSHQFYKDWTSGKLPKMLIVSMQHATPYFDDSYAVNSANSGPYGDALTRELMPVIERKFRAIGEGWARTLYGGSTGGWESLAWQVFYPTMFNGTWTNCPDPIDFREYGATNIYEDSNAFYPNSEWVKDPIRPWMRTPEHQVLQTVQQASQMELVLGTHGRSAEQFDAWQAVFAPVGKDGYPQPLWDKRTGVIDHSVAEYMRDRYDLRFILERDWPKHGRDYAGKIHLKVGDEDSFNLAEAVRLTQHFLENVENPKYGGSVEYGPRQPHCYSGSPSESVRISRLTINQRSLPEMADHITRTAVPGGDVTSWKY